MSIFSLDFVGWCDLFVDFTYQLPGHPLLVQQMLHQMRDFAPSLPKFNRLVEFWQLNLDGKLTKVLVEARPVDGQAKIRARNVEIRF